MQPAAKTCLIYCRVSSKEQVERTSLETQETDCRQHAEKCGFVVLEVFVDRGESAKTADRTEFLKAIQFCALKKPVVDFFLVHKFDRFARNAGDHLALRATLRKSGTELRSITEATSNDPAGKLMETVLAGFAEFDNNVRADRTKAGMVERVREGFWVWAPPIGYHKPATGKKTNIIPDPERAPLIRRAFEEYAKGTYTYQELAKLMENAGLRTRHGKPVSFQLVEKILHNIAYCGVIRAFGADHEAAFEPIISKSLFDSCQKGASGSEGATPAPRSVNNPAFPLRKFVDCADCGTPLTGSVTRGRHGKRYPYYHHHSKGCTKSKSIPKEIFEQEYLEFLDSVTPNLRYQKLFQAVVRDTWQTNYRNLDAENASIRRKIEKLEEERQRVFDLHRAGTYSDEDFQEQKKRVNRQLDQQLALLNDRKAEEFDMEQALSYCFDFVGKATDTWLKLANNHPARIRFQKLLFTEKLTFDGQKFGTAKLSPILQQKKTPLVEKSSLVAPRGIEPLFAP